MLRRILDRAGAPAQVRCVWEVSIGGGWGMWAIYALQRAPEVSALAEAAKAEGAQGVQTASFSSASGRVEFVSFRLPIGDRLADGGFVLFEFEKTQVIAGVGLPPQAREATPTPPSAPTPSPVGGTPTVTASPTPGPGIPLPQNVGAVDRSLRPILEEAVGRTFVPQQYFSGEQQGVTLVQITYRVVGGVPELGEASRRLAEALRARGAAAVQVDAQATYLTVTFFNLPYESGQVFLGIIEIQSTGEAQLHAQTGPR